MGFGRFALCLDGEVIFFAMYCYCVSYYCVLAMGRGSRRSGVGGLVVAAAATSTLVCFDY